MKPYVLIFLLPILNIHLNQFIQKHFKPFIIFLRPLRWTFQMMLWLVARGYKCPSIYPKFQRGLYNMFQLKKVKMRKMGKRKPPYESNHTKVTCSHYVVFIP